MGFKFAPYPGTDRPPKFKVDADANVDDPQAAPAHSRGALTLGEMGWAGLLLLLLLWMRWFQMGVSFLWQRTEDALYRINIGILFGLCGNFLQSLTEWVFHQTAIFFMVNILLGVLASLYYMKRRARRQASDGGEDADFEDESSTEPSVETEPEPDEAYARTSSA